MFCHQKGGPTNPHNVTDDPTCLDSNGSFLGQKQTTTLSNFGRVSSPTLRSLPDRTSFTPVPPKCLQDQELPALLP